MMGARGADVLMVVYFVAASVLGIGAGGLACLVLRRPWGLKVALIDAVFAAVAGIIAAYVMFVIAEARGVWEFPLGLVFLIAAGVAVLRHVVPQALRSAR